MNGPALLLSRRAASSVSSSICVSCRRSILRQFSASTRAPLGTSFQSYPLHPPSAPVNPPLHDADSSSLTAQSPAPTKLPRFHDTRPPPQAKQQKVFKNVAAPEPSTAPGQTTTSTASRSSAPKPSQPQPQPQTPTPAAPSSTTTTAKPAAAPRPRSRLRAPRKAAMKLMPAAVEQLRALLSQPEPKLIKVGVRNRGCSGLAYHLEFVDKAGPFDEAVEQDGVTVLVDSKALFSIIGSEMDWVEDKLSQKFVFRNPNIKEQCGCGESFMV